MREYGSGLREREGPEIVESEVEKRWWGGIVIRRTAMINVMRDRERTNVGE